MSHCEVRSSGFEGAGFVQVNDRVELLREPRAKAVTPPLRLRTIDYADGALEAFLAQKCRRFVALAQVQPKSWNADSME